MFDFIIPIAESTKQVKRQFSDMQNKMHDQAKQFEQQSKNQQNTSFKATPKKPSKDDYIDYEEIK
ncbi:MAG: hypothetical protein WDM71_11940 [Ferruginibacter sp.]